MEANIERINGKIGEILQIQKRQKRQYNNKIQFVSFVQIVRYVLGGIRIVVENVIDWVKSFIDFIQKLKIICR